jgi:tellurite resistance-related uncharacterized protein
VLDAAARQARIGAALDCPLCERAEMPEGLVKVEQVGSWDEMTFPPGLQQHHLSATGRWERLCVLDGQVGIGFDQAGESPGPPVQVHAGGCQVIPPAVSYRVILAAPARLELERWGRPDEAEPAGDVAGP